MELSKKSVMEEGGVKRVDVILQGGQVGVKKKKKKRSGF